MLKQVSSNSTQGDLGELASHHFQVRSENPGFIISIHQIPGSGRLSSDEQEQDISSCWVSLLAPRSRAFFSLLIIRFSLTLLRRGVVLLTRREQYESFIAIRASLIPLQWGGGKDEGLLTTTGWRWSYIIPTESLLRMGARGSFLNDCKSPGSPVSLLQDYSFKDVGDTSSSFRSGHWAPYLVSQIVVRGVSHYSLAKIGIQTLLVCVLERWGSFECVYVCACPISLRSQSGLSCQPSPVSVLWL